MRHYYNFGPEAEVVGGDLTSKAAWDRLRLDTTIDAFALPQVREAWVRLCEADDEARRRAEDVTRVVTEGGQSAVISIGVGRAHLEYWLKRERPELKLTCLEYATRTVDVLRGLFHECDLIDTFDLRAERWPRADPDTLYLCCRVDTELNDSEWGSVFSRMAAAEVRRVVFVPSGFLDARTVAREAVGRVKGLLSGRPATFAGYVRTKAAFRQLWRSGFVERRELGVGDRQAFLLERRMSR